MKTRSAEGRPSRLRMRGREWIQRREPPESYTMEFGERVMRDLLKKEKLAEHGLPWSRNQRKQLSSSLLIFCYPATVRPRRMGRYDLVNRGAIFINALFRTPYGCF